MKEKEEEKESEGAVLGLIKVLIQPNQVLCPYMSQVSSKTGGFGNVQMIVFGVECVSKSCGMYNSCQNI